MLLKGEGQERSSFIILHFTATLFLRMAFLIIPELLVYQPCTNPFFAGIVIKEQTNTIFSNLTAQNFLCTSAIIWKELRCTLFSWQETFPQMPNGRGRVFVIKLIKDELYRIQP